MNPNKPASEFKVLPHTDYRMLVREPYQHEIDAISDMENGNTIVDRSIKVVRDTVSSNDYILYGMIEHDEVNTEEQIAAGQSNAWGKVQVREISNGKIVPRYDEVINDLSMREGLSGTWRINTNSDQKQGFVDEVVNKMDDGRLGLAVDNNNFLNRFVGRELDRNMEPLDQRGVVRRHYKLQEKLDEHQENLAGHTMKEVDAIINNDRSVSPDILKAKVSKQLKVIAAISNNSMKSSLMPGSHLIADDGTLFDSAGAARFTNNKFSSLGDGDAMLLKDVEERFIVSKTSIGDRQIINSRLGRDEDVQKIITIANKESLDKTYAYIVKDGDNTLWMRATTLDGSYNVVKEDAASFKGLGINPANLTQGVVATSSLDNILKTQEPHVQDMLKQISPNNLRTLISKSQIADQAIASGQPDPAPIRTTAFAPEQALVDDMWQITELNAKQLEQFHSFHSNSSREPHQIDDVKKAFLIENANGIKTIYAISERTDNINLQKNGMVNSFDTFDRNGNRITESHEKDWTVGSLDLKEHKNVNADVIRNEMAKAVTNSLATKITDHPRLTKPFGKDNPHPILRVEQEVQRDQEPSQKADATRKPGRY